jgi:acrylyl-CoA reductase (NADPH)
MLFALLTGIASTSDAPFNYCVHDSGGQMLLLRARNRCDPAGDVNSQHSSDSPFSRLLTNSTTTRCLLLTGEPSAPVASVEQVSLQQIPNDGDVLVRVLYSAVNYKDALAVTGRGKIIRARFPFVPGIDLVGEVVKSSTSAFERGEYVIGTGWGLGETVWGGYASLQRVQSRYLVPLPYGLDPVAAITAGTAGLTAMLAVMEMENGGVSPSSGDLLVTGASGGVGSLSTVFLSALGYSVVASTGKSNARDYLGGLGAAEVVDRSVVSGSPDRPLDSARWAGAIDSVGGYTLARILSRTARHGVVASCGLVAGAKLNTTVYPFILRGVRLVGIDSNTCPSGLRSEAWGRIGQILKPDVARRIARAIRLEEVVQACESVLDGRVVGRLIVSIGD